MVTPRTVCPGAPSAHLLPIPERRPLRPETVAGGVRGGPPVGASHGVPERRVGERAREALRLAPQDARIAENVRLMEEKVECGAEE